MLGNKLVGGFELWVEHLSVFNQSKVFVLSDAVRYIPHGGKSRSSL